MYAKLINGQLGRAPKTVQWSGHMVNNPSADKLKELGYKEVTYTETPGDAPEGKHYEASWVDGDTITQVWTLVDDPVTEPSLEERLQAEIAERTERDEMMEECILEMSEMVYS